MLFGTRSAMERQALHFARRAQQYVIERYRHQFSLRGNRVSGLEAGAGGRWRAAAARLVRGPFATASAALRDASPLGVRWRRGRG